MKAPKIFFDASITNNALGIGINELYSNKTGYFKYLLKDNKLNSIEGELRAFNKAIEWAQINFPNVKEYHFFTDNKPLYQKQPIPKIKDKIIELFWVPRELNSIADKLANVKDTNQVSHSGINQKQISHSGLKKTEIKINLGSFICQKYSYKQRLALLNKIAQTKNEKKIMKELFSEDHVIDYSQKYFYTVISSFLKKEERPSFFKKIFSIQGIKSQLNNKELEILLKTV